MTTFLENTVLSDGNMAKTIKNMKIILFTGSTLFLKNQPPMLFLEGLLFLYQQK